MTQPPQQPNLANLNPYQTTDAELNAARRQQQASQFEAAKQQSAQRLQQYKQQLDTEYQAAQRQFEQYRAGLSDQAAARGQEVQGMQQAYQNPNQVAYAVPQPAYQMPQPPAQYARGGMVLPRYEGGGGPDPLHPRFTGTITYVPGQGYVLSYSGNLFAFNTLADAQNAAITRGVNASVVQGPPAPASAVRPVSQLTTPPANVTSAANGINAATNQPRTAPTAAPQPPAAAAPAAVALPPAEPDQTAAASGAPTPPAAAAPSISDAQYLAAQFAPGSPGTNTFTAPSGFTVVQFGNGFHSVWAGQNFIGTYRDDDARSPGNWSGPPPAAAAEQPQQQTASAGAPQPPGGTGAAEGPKQTTLADGSTVLTYPGGAHWVNSPTTGWHWYAGDDPASPVNGGKGAAGGASPADSTPATAPQPPAGFSPEFQAALDARAKQQKDEADRQAREMAGIEALRSRERMADSPGFGAPRFAQGGGVPMPPTAIVGEKSEPGGGYRLELIIPQHVLSQISYSDKPTGAPLPPGAVVAPVAEDAKPAQRAIKQNVPQQGGVPAVRPKGQPWQVPLPPKMAIKRK